MIDLPNFENKFEYENNFYLSCDPSRIGKLLAHYELFKLSKDSEGAIIECGVYKGASFSRFSIFRQLLANHPDKKLIAFDIFGEFPETQFEGDIELRQKFIDSSGASSISTDQLQKVLEQKNVYHNIDIVAGDICETVPNYVKENPELKISLLNLDVDIYEPSVTILEELYPRISSGGVLILDDYNTFPGETTAVDNYFKGRTDIEIKKFDFANTPHYIQKH